MSVRRGGPEFRDVADDPGGPIVALCRGHRCSALRALAGTEDRVDRLQRVVREGSGAVLVTTDCLGACALAAVAAVGHRDGASGSAGPVVWLAGMDEPDRADALVEWVAEGGPELGGDPGVPSPLVPAVVGLGPPPRFSGGAVDSRGRPHP